MGRVKKLKREETKKKTNNTHNQSWVLNWRKSDKSLLDESALPNYTHVTPPRHPTAVAAQSRCQDKYLELLSSGERCQKVLRGGEAAPLPALSGAAPGAVAAGGSGAALGTGWATPLQHGYRWQPDPCSLCLRWVQELNEVKLGKQLGKRAAGEIRLSESRRGERVTERGRKREESWERVGKSNSRSWPLWGKEWLMLHIRDPCELKAGEPSKAPSVTLMSWEMYRKAQEWHRFLSQIQPLLNVEILLLRQFCRVGTDLILISFALLQKASHDLSPLFILPTWLYSSAEWWVGSGELWE